MTIDRPALADEVLLSRGIAQDLLMEKTRKTPRELQRLSRKLVKEGLIRIDDAHYYTLTQKGLEEAWNVVHRHRLWEMFLMHEADIAADHVDRDADDIEHFLTPKLVAALERYLKIHNREPRLLPSVHPLEEVGAD